MKKLLSLVLTLCLLAALTGALAQASAEEALSVTHHTAEIAGQTLSYTATAGRLPVEVDGNQCDMFFTAYTLDGVEDPGERPVTFAFNGGPGTASLFVHLGMMGPRRVDVDDDGVPNALPTRVVDNPCSILDMTDLVFIDPVGTGYSRAAEGTDPSAFWNYDGDVASVSAFIRLYASRNGRWGSPKYVAGESYGTIRAVGVADYLYQKYSMCLNGVMLISSINDSATAVEHREEANELSYVLSLPTFAAIAWYHGKVGAQYLNMTLEAFLEDVRAFADGEYWSALFKGSQLTEAETDALAEKLVVFTGLKKDLILQKNLRIDMNTFCKSLMEDDKLFVGRLDGRYTGPATSGSIEDGDADPSATGVTEAFVTVANDIISRKLKFQSDLFYDSLSDEVNEVWTFKKYHNSFLSQEKILYNCMSRNPYLKVWVICGYYDLATPFHAAEWTYNHLFLNESSRSQLQFTYYKSGHMFYLHEPSYLQFREDAEAWFAK